MRCHFLMHTFIRDTNWVRIMTVLQIIQWKSWKVKPLRDRCRDSFYHVRLKVLSKLGHAIKGMLFWLHFSYFAEDAGLCPNSFWFHYFFGGYFFHKLKLLWLGFDFRLNLNICKSWIRGHEFLKVLWQYFCDPPFHDQKFYDSPPELQCWRNV